MAPGASQMRFMAIQKPLIRMYVLFVIILCAGELVMGVN